MKKFKEQYGTERDEENPLPLMLDVIPLCDDEAVLERWRYSDERSPASRWIDGEDLPW